MRRGVEVGREVDRLAVFQDQHFAGTARRGTADADAAVTANAVVVDGHDTRNAGKRFMIALRTLLFDALCRHARACTGVILQVAGQHRAGVDRRDVAEFGALRRAGTCRCAVGRIRHDLRRLRNFGRGEVITDRLVLLDRLRLRHRFRLGSHRLGFRLRSGLLHSLRLRLFLNDLHFRKVALCRRRRIGRSGPLVLPESGRRDHHESESRHACRDAYARHSILPKL